jgi:phage-related minor tail protein
MNEFQSRSCVRGHSGSYMPRIGLLSAGAGAVADQAETVASRLWRDRAHLREQERDEARALARIADQKVAILLAENERLEGELRRLRSILDPAPADIHGETDRQMDALREALVALLHGVISSSSPSFPSS